MRPDDVPAKLTRIATDEWLDGPDGEDLEVAIRRALAAVLPEHERQVRTQASAELAVRAGPMNDLTGPSASFRRGILPAATLQELTNAIARGEAIVCAAPKEQT